MRAVVRNPSLVYNSLMDKELITQAIDGEGQPDELVRIPHLNSNKVLGIIFFPAVVIIFIILATWKSLTSIEYCEGFAGLGCLAVLAGVLVTLIVIATVTAWLFITSLLHKHLVDSGQVDRRHSKRVTAYRYLIPAFILDLLWLQYNDMFAPNLRGFFIFVLVLIVVAMIITPIIIHADPQIPQDT